MNYEGNIIRPPSEADSIILQVTVGCSHNKCTFCGAYKGVRFRKKEQNLIDEDISFSSTYCKRQNRVFLADGDALILPYDKLLDILIKIQFKLPWVKGVSCYGNAKSIRSKTVDQLITLKHKGLDRIYLGLESGDPEVLNTLQKGETFETMIEASKRVHSAGLYLCVTVLLGIAGKKLSHQHAKATGDVLTKMKPKQVAALTFMPLHNTSLYDDIVHKKFTLLSPQQILTELRVMLLSIDLDKTLFYANHASNYLPISGRLKRDKEKFINIIDKALAGSIDLKPERLRAL